MTTGCSSRLLVPADHRRVLLVGKNKIDRRAGRRALIVVQHPVHSRVAKLSDNRVLHCD